MIQKRKLTVFSLLLAFLLCLSAGVVTVFLRNTDTFAATVWEESEVEAEYPYGSIFDPPARKVTVDGTEVDAAVAVRLPDGRAVQGKPVELIQTGKYTVLYTARHNDRVYAEEESFFVHARTAFYSAESSAVFEERSVTGSLYNSNMEVIRKETTEVEGLFVSLAEGDNLSFSKIIDVSSVTKEDVLIDCFAVPQKSGVMDFERLLFTFTDVSDPSVQLTVSCRQTQDPNPHVCYMQAAGNGQRLQGLENGNKVHVEGPFGKAMWHSFREPIPSDPGRRIRVAYDAKTVSAHAVMDGDTLIMDMDNPAYYSKLWHGFPSGKVRLSVTADMYSSSRANFCILNVPGIDLSSEVFLDEVPPVLTVDPAFEEMPPAKVGMSYPIPNATAYDEYSGACEVDVSVYHNYNSQDKGTLVDVADGAFFAKYPGHYAIVYEARDGFDNLSTEIRWVHASGTLAPPEVTATLDPEYELGEVVDVSDYFADPDSTVTVSVSINDDVFTVNGSFLVTEEGTYEVTFTATDYIGQQGTCVCTFRAVKPQNPVVFVDEFVFPKVLINNQSYTMPAYYVDDATSGRLEKKLAALTVTDSLGTREIPAGERFVPVVNENGATVRITASHSGQSKSVDIPCVRGFYVENETEKLNTVNFFLTQNTTVAAGADGVIVTAGASNGGVMFANALTAEDLSVRILGVKGKSNFRAMNLLLCDSRNESIAIRLRLVNTAEGVVVEQGGKSIALTGKFDLGSSFGMNYNRKQFRVGETTLDVTSTENGEEFDGFPSGKCYVYLAFEEATVGDEIVVSQIDNQVMGNVSYDLVPPKIVPLGDCSGIRKLNEVVVFPGVVAGDVLSPELFEFTLTVTGPDGSVLRDENGMLLKDVNPGQQYSFVLGSYGVYRMTITANDRENWGNPVSTEMVIRTLDDIPPEIRFDGAIKTTLRKGEMILIPNVIVSDNSTAAEEITVRKYVRTSNGILVTLPDDSNAFVCKYSGEYEVQILAVDGAGNISMLYTKITVEE